LLYYECPESKPSKKIAAFGFNRSLANISLFLSGENGWTLRYTDIPEKLLDLHNAGYKIVIFSNHSPIGKAVRAETKEKAVLQQIKRTGGVAEAINVPINIFIATAKISKSEDEAADIYRKPATGMWDFLIENCNGGVKPEIGKCFYVGGLAGRQKSEVNKHADHSDYDLKFAENVGLKFILDNEYFREKGHGPALGIKKKAKVEKSAEETQAEANAE
jgi:bifunctional polynucleotide phosphatase/kinase